MAKKSAQLNVRIDPDVLDSLEAIENNHGITQSVLVRHLLAAVDAFYKKNKWFSLPATVTPEKFQNQAAAIGTQEVGGLSEKIAGHHLENAQTLGRVITPSRRGELSRSKFLNLPKSPRTKPGHQRKETPLDKF